MTYDLRKRGNSDIDTYVGRRPREHETAGHKPKAEPATGPPHSLRSQPGRCLDLCLLATQIVVIGYGGPSHKAAGKITRAEKEERSRDGIRVGTTGIAGGQRRQWRKTRAFSLEREQWAGGGASRRISGKKTPCPHGRVSPVPVSPVLSHPHPVPAGARVYRQIAPQPGNDSAAGPVRG